MANAAMKKPEWQAKKARQRAEGVAAWTEYLQQQRSVSDRIAKQRQARLERETQPS